MAPDVVADASFPRTRVAAREGLRAAFGFPVILRGDVFGIMEFFSREIREPDLPLRLDDKFAGGLAFCSTALAAFQQADVPTCWRSAAWPTGWR